MGLARADTGTKARDTLADALGLFRKRVASRAGGVHAAFLKRFIEVHGGRSWAPKSGGHPTTPAAKAGYTTFQRCPRGPNI